MLAIQNATSDDVIVIFAYEFKLVFWFIHFICIPNSFIKLRMTRKVNATNSGRKEPTA